MENFIRSAVFIVVTTLVIASSFLITSGLYWVVCWDFDLTFGWKYAVGIFASMIIIRSIFTR